MALHPARACELSAQWCELRSLDRFLGISDQHSQFLNRRFQGNVCQCFRHLVFQGARRYKDFEITPLGQQCAEIRQWDVSRRNLDLRLSAQRVRLYPLNPVRPLAPDGLANAVTLLVIVSENAGAVIVSRANFNTGTPHLPIPSFQPYGASLPLTATRPYPLNGWNSPFPWTLTLGGDAMH